MPAVSALPATHTPILQPFRLTRSTSSMTIDVLASGCQPVMRQRRSHRISRSRTSSRVFRYSTIIARSLIPNIAYRAVAQCLTREVAEYGSSAGVVIRYLFCRSRTRLFCPQRRHLRQTWSGTRIKAIYSSTADISASRLPCYQLAAYLGIALENVDRAAARTTELDDTLQTLSLQQCMILQSLR